MTTHKLKHVPQFHPRWWRFYAIAAGAFAVALAIGWLPIARQFDSYHYDWLMRLYPPATSAKDAVLLAFDEQTLIEYGGQRGMRRALAAALDAAGSMPK